MERRAGAAQSGVQAARRASLTAYDPYKQLTELRSNADFGQYHVGCQRSALNRLHKTFQGFFARVKAGKKAGFPRFKGRGRVRSFEYPNPPVKRVNRRWVLAVKGVGKFRFKHDERLNTKPLPARIVADAVPREGATLGGHAGMRLARRSPCPRH